MYLMQIVKRWRKNLTLLSVLLLSSLAINLIRTEFNEKKVIINLEAISMTQKPKQSYNFTNYKEPYRPQFHYSPPKFWMNDPCGLIYHKGEYHLFYEHNPEGMHQAMLSWGHAVSRDLLHWETLPLVFKHNYPHNDYFSGSSVIDDKNTAGFGAGAFVVVYTMHHFYKNNQNQHIAYSLDDGHTFTQYQFNPVIGSQVINIRDPKVFWYEPLSEWRMVISDSFVFKILIFGSKNLKDWEYLSRFEGKGIGTWIWETPDLFQMEVRNKPGVTKWVLLIGVKNYEKKLDDWSKAYSTQAYFLGDFDGYNFITDYPDTQLRYMDFGHDFFAGQTFGNAPKDRRILTGWMNAWLYADKFPTVPWRGATVLPRELNLVHNHCNKGRLELIQEPISELKKLRTEQWKWKNIRLAHLVSKIKAVKGKTLEIETSVIIHKSQDWFHLSVLSNSINQTVIGYKNKKHLFVDVSKSGFQVHRDFSQIKREAVLPPCNNRIELRIFVDWSSVEIFANYGSLTMTNNVLPAEDYDQVHIKGTKNLKFEYFNVYLLESIW